MKNGLLFLTDNSRIVIVKRFYYTIEVKVAKQEMLWKVICLLTFLHNGLLYLGKQYMLKSKW